MFSLKFYILFVGLVIAMASAIDWLISKDEERKLKSNLFEWWFYLGRFNYRKVVRKANIRCNRLLNTIYGKKHFSLRCIFVSFSISILLSFSMIVLYKNLAFLYSSFVDLLISVVVFNLLTDYISLIETRFILRISVKTSFFKLLGLLLFDIISSFLIFVIVSFLMLPIGIFIVSCLGFRSIDINYLSLGFQNTAKALYGLCVENETYSRLAIIFLITTLSTSILFYIYCLSSILFKMLNLSKSRLQIILEKIEASNNLFKAIAGLLAMFVGIFKAVYELMSICINRG